MRITTARLALFALGLAAGCAASGDDPDLELAEGDAGGPKADGPGWEIAPTLHVGDARFDRVDANSRRVHALWVDASADAPVPLRVTVTGHDAARVRVAVLGPLRGGGRPVLGAAGYSQATGEAEVTVELTERGQHLVVVGSYGLASEAFYDVVAHCDPWDEVACAPARVDALAAPKAGALAGVRIGADAMVSAELGGALADRDFDVELVVLASPPAQSWNAVEVAVSVASGTQVNAILPPTVAPGDDLLLVLRAAGGPVLDTGVWTRFAPEPSRFARLDSILYGDLASLEVSGVVGYYEAVAEMVLHSEDTGRDIATHVLHADRPGEVGNGWNAFDATFAPDLVGPDGELNPDLPHNGELLSIGDIGGGDGVYRRLGCFEYCNDLAGDGTCTGGPRPCP